MNGRPLQRSLGKINKAIFPILYCLLIIFLLAANVSNNLIALCLHFVVFLLLHYVYVVLNAIYSLWRIFKTLVQCCQRNHYSTFYVWVRDRFKFATTLQKLFQGILRLFLPCKIRSHGLPCQHEQLSTRSARSRLCRVDLLISVSFTVFMIVVSISHACQRFQNMRRALRTLVMQVKYGIKPSIFVARICLSCIIRSSNIVKF